MEPRMKHPARQVPGALQALLALGNSAQAQGVPSSTLRVVHLRASQINGCELCIQLHAKEMADEGDAGRIDLVADWRDSDAFTDDERVALALAEAVTRLADNPDPVPDDLWAEATSRYDEKALSALLVSIASVNAWNRLNAATKQDMSAFDA